MSVINVKNQGEKNVINFYGGCKEFLTAQDHQVFLYGSAGSGKTSAMTTSMMLRCMLYPGVKFLFTRKSYRSLIKSGVETFERVLRSHGWQITNKPHPTKIHKLGETEPREFRFPYAKRIAPKGDNPKHVYEGVSRVVLSSLDRVYDEMGAEYDYVYVNQPEQITEDDWQFLTTRANGRRGVAPYPQLMGDPNPEHEKHWIKLGGYVLGEDGQKTGDGTRWRIIKSPWTDNPMLFDHNLNIPTKDGDLMIGRLRESLNPVMAKRLIDGDWCSYEGLVYGGSWDASRHIKPPDYYIGETWDRYWGVDFGLREPFALTMFAKNPDTGQFVCYRQIVETDKTIVELGELVRNATIGEPRPKLVVADRDPERIRILSEALGLNIISAKKGAGSVKAGINAVTDMLRKDQIVFVRDNLFQENMILRAAKKPIGFEEEVENYRWDIDREGDAVIGENDHSCDSMRYLFTHIKANERVIPFIWT